MNIFHVLLAPPARYVIIISEQTASGDILEGTWILGSSPLDGLTTVHFHLGSADKMRLPRCVKIGS